MRFRAAFRVCESRDRAPFLLQPQASRSFSQLPLFKPPTKRRRHSLSPYKMQSCSRELKNRRSKRPKLIWRKILLIEREKLKAQSFTKHDYISTIQIYAPRKELEEKVDELQSMDTLNQTLILKEHRSNFELQHARKELINGLQDIWNDQDLFGIKRMGEVNEKPFKGVCFKKFPNDWELKSAELIALWQANVSNPMWHPFKAEFVDGKLQVLCWTLVMVSVIQFPYMRGMPSHMPFFV